jgi:protein-S-isoprenylcysteine O-methyltransferase Ste14
MSCPYRLASAFPNADASESIMMTVQEDQRKPQLLDWIAGLLTFVLLVLNHFLERGGVLFLRRIGVIVLLGVLLLAFLPIFTLRKYGRVQEGESYMNTSVVVDRGLYSTVRHPQYLAYMLFNLGFMLFSQNCVIVLLGALAIAFFYLHTIDEERFCRKRFGEEYEQYIQKVPRFNLPLGIIRLYRRSRRRLRNKKT